MFIEANVFEKDNEIKYLYINTHVYIIYNNHKFTKKML